MSLSTCLVLFFELDRHRFGMVASRTFKGALIVVRPVSWLDASKPHSLTAFEAWRFFNQLGRIMEIRLLHDALSRYLAQAGVRLVSQPPTPGTEPRSMMLKRCAQSTTESIRERLETRKRHRLSKWNSGQNSPVISMAFRFELRA